MKTQLINKITNFNADLVWEIDKSEYYGMIGWNGGLKNDSYWLEHNLLEKTNEFLKKLLKELLTNKNIKQ